MEPSRIRASIFGWHDTYAVSKAMGEMAPAEQHKGAEGEGGAWGRSAGAGGGGAAEHSGECTLSPCPDG
ncbi:unnamed protein product [Closterium sp. Yama58-4]|nr:unnamed protein product [Closterium sp. Yama58-4]